MKHHDYNKRYHENKTWRSSDYCVFIARITKYGRDKEKAIIKTNKIKKPNSVKGVINDKGRECTVCSIYKQRSEYHKSASGVYGHTNNCRECRNNLKREYRLRTNYATDRALKKKRRTLNIGEKIKLKDLTKRGDTRIHPIREVVEYQFKKGYTLFSPEYKVYRQLDTNDNKINNRNSVGFYHV